MPRNGSGAYSLPSGNPVVTGTTISSTTHNTTMSDIATALTASIAKDGQTTPTANLPMGGYKHTGVAVAASLTDYSRADQVQNGAFQWLTSVSGADTITASAIPVPSAYAAGQTFRFVSAGANTGAATLNISSLGAKSITKNGTTALAAGDIPSGVVVEVVYDGTQFQLVSLWNRAASGANADITSLSALTTPLSIAQGGTGTAYGARSKLEPISASVAGNALTISASALSLDFRSTTLGSGTVTTVSGTPANLVISSGSTLGTVNGVQSRIVVLAINNAGTLELAAVNIAGGNDLSETGLISTTAEGGAGAADSANVIYSTTTRTNVAYRVIGYVESTQATAGTWATAPSTIQGAGGQALTALSSLGYGQTWQDVSASRASGTTYYNTTGRPIFVSVSGSNASSSTLSLVVNGVTVATIGMSAGGNIANLYTIVPPSASYSLSVSAGSITSKVWTELR